MEKWITCKSCGHTYSNKLRRCPNCGHSSPIGLKQITAFSAAALVIVAALLGFVLGLKDKGQIQTPPDGETSAISSVQPTDSSDLNSSDVKETHAENSSAVSSAGSKAEKPAVSSKASSSTSKKPAASKTESVKPPTDNAKLPNNTVTATKTEDTVLISIPAEWVQLIEEMELGAVTELDEQDKQYGIKSLVKTVDGSLVITFTKDGYELYKKDLRNNMKEVITEINVPFIDKVTCVGDFDTIEIHMNTDKYNADNDADALEGSVWASGVCAYIYKTFIGKSNSTVTVKVLNQENQVILTESFPQ